MTTRGDSEWLTRRQRRVLVTGAGGFIGHHLVAQLKATAPGCVASISRNRSMRRRQPTNSRSATSAVGRTVSRHPRHRRRLRARGGHGRHGLHLESPRADPAQQPVDQHAHPRCRAAKTASSAISTRLRRVSIPSIGRRKRTSQPLREEESVSRAAAGRVRVGEAAHRAAVPPLLARTMESRRESCASTTSSVLSGPGTVDAKRPRPLCAARSRQPNSPARTKIDIWGDGEQTRSFCYIDDCVNGILRLMESDFREPLNLGQDRLISINELADLVAAAAGITVRKRHVPGPQGVRGRNSDNSRLRAVLGLGTANLSRGRNRADVRVDRGPSGCGAGQEGAGVCRRLRFR